jgi:hypothetical protein
VNPFARHARERKALALARFIDGNTLRRGLSPAVSAEHVVNLLTNVWTPEHWAKAAERAGVRVPSEETRRAVVELYRARAERRSA